MYLFLIYFTYLLTSLNFTHINFEERWQCSCISIPIYLFTHIFLVDGQQFSCIPFFSVHFPYLLVLFSLYLRGGWMAVFVSLRYVDFRLRSSAAWNGCVSDLSWRVMC